MKKTIVTALTFALLGVSTAASFADSVLYDTRHHQMIGKVEKNNDKDAIAAGVLGLTAGAILGGVLSKKSEKHVSSHAYPPARHHSPKYNKKPRKNDRHYNKKQWSAPYSPEWHRYCSSKYRSFNPRTGTYRTYNGKVQFCEIPSRERKGRR